MKRQIAYGLMMLLGVVSAASADVTAAETTIRTMVDGVLDVLRQDHLDTDSKMDAILEVITPVIDFPLMAKLTLGRAAWPKLSQDQQQEFTDLFVKKLRRVYTTQVENFSGETVVFEDAKQVGSKVHLSSYVLSEGDRISILYKLYKSGDRWKVYDLEIQGVSMIRSYNAQFVPVIRDRSAEALLQELRTSLTDSE